MNPVNNNDKIIHVLSLTQQYIYHINSYQFRP